jgi:hypothetical protein
MGKQGRQRCKPGQTKFQEEQKYLILRKSAQILQGHVLTE